MHFRSISCVVVFVIALVGCVNELKAKDESAIQGKTSAILKNEKKPSDTLNQTKTQKRPEQRVFLATSANLSNAGAGLDIEISRRNLARNCIFADNGHLYSWSAIFNGYDRERMTRECPYPGIRGRETGGQEVQLKEIA